MTAFTVTRVTRNFPAFGHGVEQETEAAPARFKSAEPGGRAMPTRFARIARALVWLVSGLAFGGLSFLSAPAQQAVEAQNQALEAHFPGPWVTGPVRVEQACLREYGVFLAVRRCPTHDSSTNRSDESQQGAD